MRLSIRCFFFVITLSLMTPARAQVMLGAYLPGDGWRVDEITRFNENSTKPLAFINLFSAFSHSWSKQLIWQTSNIYNNGAIPLISLMPIDLDDRKRNILPEIIEGQWDDYIDSWIKGFMSWVKRYPKNKKPVILLRFAHEFNGNWYPYSGKPSSFVRSWIYMHRRFQQAGANEFIEWVWNANHISYDGYDNMTLYYPGNAYVDWTALDGYNWGTNHDWTEWDSFESVFAAAYDTLVNYYPTKPILIAEYGTAEPDDLPSINWMQYGNDQDKNQSRSVWFMDMLDSIEKHFPAIRGLGLFSYDKELSWSLNGQSSTGMEGYNLGTQSEYFTSKFLSARVALSTPPVKPRRKQATAPELLAESVYITADSPGPKAHVKKLTKSNKSIASSQREGIDYRKFTQSIKVRQPPRSVVQEAKEKSKIYRARVRALSEGKRAEVAIRGGSNL